MVITVGRAEVLGLVEGANCGSGGSPMSFVAVGCWTGKTLIMYRLLVADM